MFGKKKEKKPEIVSCFFCSQDFENYALKSHYKEHLIQVTDNDGQTAYTFRCPKCGMMDMAWGGRSLNDNAAQTTAAFAIAYHLDKEHFIPMH